MPYIPTLSFSPSLKFPNLAGFLAEFENLGTISGGVAVYGPAAAYALVWEYGAPPPWHIKKPGPKTLWATNSLGETKIMARSAPEGYIAIHQDEIWSLLETELQKLKFKSKTEDGIRLELEVAVDNASQEWARRIADSAPVDSGDLRAGIDYVESKFGDTNET